MLAVSTSANEVHYAFCSFEKWKEILEGIFRDALPVSHRTVSNIRDSLNFKGTENKGRLIARWSAGWTKCNQFFYSRIEERQKGVEIGHYYMVGQHRFSILYLEKEVIEEAVRQAGFVIKWIEETRIKCPPSEADAKGRLVLLWNSSTLWAPGGNGQFRLTSAVLVSPVKRSHIALGSHCQLEKLAQKPKQSFAGGGARSLKRAEWIPGVLI
ncbi:hypothetical protein L345_00695, partial [Ophiophagus hannah]